MESSFRKKHLIIGAIAAFLTAVIFFLWNTSVAVVALIAQIGLFAAIMSSHFALWQLAIPAVSYGIGYLITDDPITAALSLVYVPVSAVITVCLRKKVSRGATVVLSSVTTALVAFACVAVAAFLSGVKVSADGITAFISETGNSVANSLVSGIPDSLFTNGLTRAAYTAAIVEGLKYFSLSFIVLFCNVIAFSSTAVTKRAVLSMENKEMSRLNDWLFVLSKPSAAMYIICYFCLFIGGETLTLPQQIAFNTVMVAIQGGVFVMAFRHLREKISVNGFPSVVMYIIIFFFFGLSAAAIVLSFVGVLAAFKQKTKGDDKKCEN